MRFFGGTDSDACGVIGFRNAFSFRRHQQPGVIVDLVVESLLNTSVHRREPSSPPPLSLSLTLTMVLLDSAFQSLLAAAVLSCLATLSQAEGHALPRPQPAPQAGQSIPLVRRTSPLHRTAEWIEKTRLAAQAKYKVQTRENQEKRASGTAQSVQDSYFYYVYLPGISRLVNDEFDSLYEASL